MIRVPEPVVELLRWQNKNHMITDLDYSDSVEEAQNIFERLAMDLDNTEKIATLTAPDPRRVIE